MTSSSDASSSSPPPLVDLHEVLNRPYRFTWEALTGRLTPQEAECVYGKFATVLCVQLSRPIGGVRYPPLKKNGIKNAAEIGRKKIHYFRARDYLYTLVDLRGTHVLYLKILNALFTEERKRILNEQPNGEEKNELSDEMLGSWREGVCWVPLYAEDGERLREVLKAKIAKEEESTRDIDHEAPIDPTRYPIRIVRIEKFHAVLAARILMKRKLISRARNAVEDKQNQKWPDKLYRTADVRRQQSNKPDWYWEADTDPDLINSDYFILNYEPPAKNEKLYVALIVLAPLAFATFGAWPIWVKIGIWYLACFFLAFFLCAIFVRLIVFLLLWPIGFEFWILPNLLDDTIPWWQAFWPLFSFERCYMDEATLIGRACVLMLGLLIGGEYQRSGMVWEEVVESYFVGVGRDVLDWGVMKLEGGKGLGRKLALESVEDLEKGLGRKEMEEYQARRDSKEELGSFTKAYMDLREEEGPK